MPKHAILSASGAHRWLECTPSARLESQVKRKSSREADEGTFAHDVAAIEAIYRLEELKDEAYKKEIERIRKNEFYSVELHDHANAYVDYIKERLEAVSDSYCVIEARFDLSDYVPEGFGTADCIIIGEGVIEVIDLKYGKGVQVEAKDNPQMRLYALGALTLYDPIYDITSVKTTIYQPRLGGISSEEISAKELKKWGEEYVKPRAALAFKGAGDFCPSDKVCRWCAIGGECRARAEANLALFDIDETLLSTDEIGELLKKSSDITSWLKAMEEKLFGALMSGDKVDGWKLVRGRSNRKYADELKVKDALLAAGYDEALFIEPKLITLTQMEKDLGKKVVSEIIGDLIIKPEGSPTLAPESDKRVEYQPDEEIKKLFTEED